MQFSHVRRSLDNPQNLSRRKLGGLMRLEVFVAFVLSGFALYVAKPQDTPQYKEVTAEAALSQIDMAIVTDKMNNRSPLETIEHIKEISALNQLQASIAQLK